jgi:hypothetical protein
MAERCESADYYEYDYYELRCSSFEVAVTGFYTCVLLLIDIFLEWR